eukprot:Em0012g585a
MYELNTGDDDNQPNESNCSVPENKGILTTGASVCGVSIIACVVPIILVVTLKLHRQFTYRAALYQVVAALLFVLALLLDTIFAMMMGSNNHSFQSPCKFAAFMIQFFLWLKLLFVSLIVVHLFMFAIVYKNIRSSIHHKHVWACWIVVLDNELEKTTAPHKSWWMGSLSNFRHWAKAFFCGEDGIALKPMSHKNVGTIAFPPILRLPSKVLSRM